MSENAEDSTRTPSFPDKGTIVERAIVGASAGSVVGGWGGLAGAIAGAIVGALVNNGGTIKDVITHHHR